MCKSTVRETALKREASLSRSFVGSRDRRPRKITMDERVLPDVPGPEGPVGCLGAWDSLQSTVFSGVMTLAMFLGGREKVLQKIGAVNVADLPRPECVALKKDLMEEVVLSMQAKSRPANLGSLEARNVAYQLGVTPKPASDVQISWHPLQNGLTKSREDWVLRKGLGLRTEVLRYPEPESSARREYVKANGANAT